MGADDAADLAHQRFAHVQIFTEVVLDGLHFPQAGRITGNSGKVRADAAQLFDLLEQGHIGTGQAAGLTGHGYLTVLDGDEGLDAQHPARDGHSGRQTAVLIASILVKLWMSGFNRTIGRIIGSETLIATAADSRNDVLSTGAVLIAAVLCRVTGWDVLDGLMGVGVAAFILISGWGLVMDTLSPLLGESPSEDLVDHIEQKVLSYPGVLGMHDLMVHDYGPGHQFASLHVELPAEQDPLEAHDLIDNIERDFLKNDRLLVTIHYDPIVTSDAAVGVLRARLTEKLRQLDPALSLHDLRIVPGRTHTNVLFDLVLPAGYAGDKVELLEQLEQFIKEQDTAYSCIIKVEQSYTAAHK